ncbi:MAG: MinD/ParA family protein [Actinomycetota bacterium]
MTRTVSVHSFRGGTGKSNTVASLAVLVGQHGLRVGVIDTDIQSPGIHVLFGLEDTELTNCLNDFLWDRCPIEATARDVTPDAVAAAGGTIFLIPSSIDAGAIARVVREGYDIAQLHTGLRELGERLDLDMLLIDTHPGLNDETLLSIAVSDELIVVLRPDRQDFQGTDVTITVARRLEVPALSVLVNKAPTTADLDQLERDVASAYGCPVAAVLPHADEMMELGSGTVFALRFPDHPVTAALRSVADRLVADGDAGGMG